MTLGAFLDAGYAVIVEEQRHLTGSLIRALDANEQWRAGGPADSPDPENVTPAVERQVERENVQAMAELSKLMSGTQFSGGIG